MWIVIKYKNRELNSLKENLIKTLGDKIEFCLPKIKYQKNVRNKLRSIEQFILGNYAILYHEKLVNDLELQKLKYLKGLDYVLNNFKHNQKEIISFINYCKKFEDESGYLTQGFFENSLIKNGKFINGPFTDMMFSIISQKKTKLKILIGNLVTTISKNTGYLYRSI